MSEVTVRIYLGSQSRQLTVNEAIIYLATGLMPFDMWKRYALDEDVVKFQGANAAERREILLRPDPVVVAAGFFEDHESKPFRPEGWRAWHPLKGTEIDIYPRHIDPAGRVMLSLAGPRASNTDNVSWLLQTLGSAQQIARSAEVAAPVIEERTKENES